MTLTPTDRRTLAIAFITGHATSDQSAQYRALFAEDTQFRAEVQELQLWLAPLSAEVEDVSPPTDLLDAIYADIDALEPDEGTAPEAELLIPVAENDRVDASVWKTMTGVFAATALFAIGSHFVDFGSQDAVPVADTDPMLAVLQNSPPQGLVAILYDPEAQTVVARFENIDAPTEGDYQLWRIRADDGTPVSLGLLRQTDGGLKLNVTDALRSGADTLAISLERPGGSTSGAPEGPVLYTGVVNPLLILE